MILLVTVDIDVSSASTVPFHTVDVVVAAASVLLVLLVALYAAVQCPFRQINVNSFSRPLCA